LTAGTLALRISRKTQIAFFLSVGYALFVSIFPWKEISKSGFSDYEQYVDYFNYFYIHSNLKIYEIYQISEDIYKFSTLKEYFTREVLWFELVRWLTDQTGEAEIALKLISFLILFVWGFFLFNRVSYGVALLFLFNPIAVDVAISGIRNGLAWSLVIIGLTTQSKIIKATLFLIGMFIHSSVLVLAIFYYFTEFVGRYVKGRAFLLIGLGVGILIGLALTVGNELFLGAIGDRRVGENYVVGGGSFMQASVWGVLLFLQCMSGRSYVRNNIFVIMLLTWYMTMNPFIPWSFRIWGAFLPVIACSVINLSPRKRQIFIYIYSVYLVLQYFYWTNLFYYWYPA
jgi:drug/metabolite transporter superfamily protein YnfA